MPAVGRVTVCDFGVSVITSDETMKRGPRGALKYYPIKAVDSPDYYEPWCDSYFAALSLLEVLMEEKVFPDSSTSSAIQMRRSGIRPDIPDDIRQQFFEPVSWFEEMFDFEESER